MTSDLERWAEARALRGLYGADAWQWITQRIAAMTAEGDVAEVKRLRSIARHLNKLPPNRGDAGTE